ncbi:MAG TPA: hypothetical protein VLK58_04610 [Conexibacter sp.]|nr:hypothetical protein [Conexibacter sp.]
MTASDQPRRRRLPKPATVIAGVALFAAVGGTATAASTLIDGKNIRAGTITARQVKNGSLGTADLSRAARAALRGARGATGATGATGAAGPQGAPGAQGLPGAQGAQGLQGIEGPQGPAGRDGVVTPQSSTLGGRNLAAGATTRVLSKTVPSGRYVVFAKMDLYSEGTEIFGCNLLSGASSIDDSNWRPAAIRLTTPLSLQGVTPTTTTTVSVSCSTPDGISGAASNVSLIAIPFG